MVKVYAIKETKNFLKLMPLNIRLVRKGADLYIVDEENFKYKKDKFFIVILKNRKNINKYLHYDNLDVLLSPFSFEEFFLRVRTFYYLIKQNKKIKKQYTLLLRESKNKLVLDIINTLAHKIRQPLQVINLLITSLMFKNLDVSKDELKESFDAILKANKEISEVFDEFFRFFDKEMKIEEFNLSQIIKEFEEIELNVKTDIKIVCDKKRLFKVLSYLIKLANVEKIELRDNIIRLKVNRDIDFFLKSGDNIKIFIIKKIIEECLNARMFQKNSNIFIEILGGGEI